MGRVVRIAFWLDMVLLSACAVGVLIVLWFVWRMERDLARANTKARNSGPPE